MKCKKMSVSVTITVIADHFSNGARTNNLHRLLTTIALVCCCATLSDAACGETLGTTSPVDYSDTLDTNSEYMFFEPAAASTCCGFLTNVQLYSNAKGNVKAMVWRKIGGTNYRLVAEESLTVNAIGISSLPLTTPIEINDVVGWYAPTEFIPFGTGTSLVMSQLRGTVNIGSDVNWSLSPTTTKIYAWGVSTKENTAPVGTATTVSVADTEIAGFVIHTVAFTDADTSEDGTHIVSMSASSQFGFDPATKEITVAGALTVGPETVTITVKDACNTVTFDVTINVINSPPNIVSGCSVVTTALSDDTTTQVAVHTFRVTDTDLTGCTITPAEPNFEIRDTPPDKQIWTTVAVSLDYDTKSQYVLDIVCVDASNLAVTCSVTVTLSDLPPVMSGLPSTYTPLNDLTEALTPLGTFTLTDTTADVARLLCQFDPTNTDFSVVAGAAPNYAISLNAANSIDFDNGATVTLTVKCTDTVNIVTGIYTVTLEDGQPVVTGLPQTYTTLSDGVQTATKLGTFTCVDRNDVCTCTTSTPEYFEIKNSFEVWVKDGVTIPLSAAPQIDLTITCSDGDTADVTGSFTVEIGDAAPVFVGTVPTVHSVTLSDATTPALCFDTFTVSDPDAACSLNPTHTDYTVTPKSPQVNPPEFELCLSGGANPNFDTEPIAVLTLSCTDNVNPAITTDYTISYSDDPPVLVSGLDATYTGVSDSNPNEENLGSLSITDSDDVIGCVFNPANPNFEIRPVSATSYEFAVYKIANAALNVINSPMALLVSCTDNVNPAITGTISVELVNGPPIFLNLPDATPTISEAEVGKSCVFTVSASDSTDLECYLSDPSAVPGILIEKKTTGPPTTEYDICVQQNAGLDAELTPTLAISVTCTDYTDVITDTLTLKVLDEAPLITSGACSATIPDTNTAEVNIYTITVSEAATCTLPGDGGGVFALDGLNNIVKTAGDNLDFSTTESYALSFQCTAGVNSVSGTCDVTIGNTGPKITNDKVGHTINEGETTEVNIMTFVTSEQAADCKEDGVVTPGFTTKIVPGTSDWALFYDTSVGLVYGNKKFYVFDMVCSDTDGQAGDLYKIELTVLKDIAPQFTTLPGTAPIKAKETPAETVVHTIAPTDPDGDDADITATLTSCLPEPCSFAIDPITGEIKATENLALHKIPSHTLCIEIADAKNTVPCRELMIDIEINDIPEITNLDLNDGVPVIENSAIGKTLYDINFDDDDTDDTHTFTCTSPNGGEEFFECNAKGEVILRKAIDFETINQHQYEMNVVVNDGYEDSPSKKFFLNIKDDNEPVTFANGPFSLNKPDEGVVDKDVGCPDYTLNDEDRSDIHTYKMTCPASVAGYFVMNPRTGCVRLLREWDTDASNQASLSVTCTVDVYDKGKLTDSQQLEITINDEDDNPPILSQTSYDSCVATGSSGGALTGATATDNDVLDANKEHTYSLVGGDAGAFTVDGQGNMIVNPQKDLSGLPAGTTFTSTLRVTDAGNNFDEAKVTMTICDPTPTTTTPITDAPASLEAANTTNSNVIWIALLGIMGLIGLGVLAFMIYRCCRNGRCCRKNPVKIRKVTPANSRRRGSIANLNLPTNHYYARNVGNVGTIIPT